jgi:hypothetical protein
MFGLMPQTYKTTDASQRTGLERLLVAKLKIFHTCVQKESIIFGVSFMRSQVGWTLAVAFHLSSSQPNPCL